MKSLYAVILAGGSGTRFWPVSRSTRPKQLLPITGKKAMIVETFERMRPLVSPKNVWVVTHESQAKAIAKLLPQIPKKNILAEPLAKNTAASIGWAAATIGDLDPDATLAVLPADHAIEPKEKFQNDLLKAAQLAAKGDLFTFGIRPSFPSSGYGYLERGARLSTDAPVYKVKRFTEKPDRATAERFLAAGNYYWNGGIFVWRQDAIRGAIESLMPKLHQALEKILVAQKKRNAKGALKKIFASLDSISIDYGVMEKAPNVCLLETSFNWSDVGSWTALALLMQKPGQPNVEIFPGGGEFLQKDSSDCLVFSEEGHTIAAIGMKNVVIVRTPDATLVCPRERAEEVKNLVEELQRRKQKELL